MELALAQLEIEGDETAANRRRALDAIGRAADQGADPVALPEIFTVGVTTCYDLRFPALYRDLVDAGATLLGRSSVSDPWGTTVAGLGEKPGLATARIDPETVESYRERFPALDDRRP
jgi:predicted amidohydrolase